MSPSSPTLSTPPIPTIGTSTTSSSLSSLVSLYRPRSLKRPTSKLLKNPVGSQGAENSDKATELLTMKCIKVIVANFAHAPLHSGVPAAHMREITSRLPSTLDPGVAAVHVFDESYWKRACLEGLPKAACSIVEHGLTWKQLFFERHLQARLETLPGEGGAATIATEEKGEKTGSSDAVEELLAEIAAFQDYIFCLRFEQLPSHVDVDLVCAALPNLTSLKVSYGINKIGMNFDRRLFGMKISDASSLAKSVKAAPNLTTVQLSGNLMDDDLLRMLMTGLYKSSTITHLDVSHNKITNHGVRLLAKLLGAKSVLTSLNIADNQVHAEGGRYLGRALRGNDSLTDLNLRLNRLTDEGGRMLLEGLRDNQSVTRLNLSGNSLGSESAVALGVALREPDSAIAVLDFSGNGLGSTDVETLAAALGKNGRVVSVDLRMNSTEEGCEAAERIEEVVRRNELRMRDE